MRENCVRAAVLARLLIDRGRVPAIRLAVFSDDEYALSRGKSPFQHFSKNGNSATEILQHPHFLAWLRYFIYGANLPETLVLEFQQKVHDMGMITSGDLDDLTRLVRPLAKRHNLSKCQADEVYKLALDLELDVDFAHTLRTEVVRLAQR